MLTFKPSSKSENNDETENVNGAIVMNMVLKGQCQIRKNIFACLFSVHNTICLSRQEQVCLIRLAFKRYFSNHHLMMGDDGRSVS